MGQEPYERRTKAQHLADWHRRQASGEGLDDEPEESIESESEEPEEPGEAIEPQPRRNGNGHQHNGQPIRAAPKLYTSAYVQSGKLYIVGLCPCSNGVVPFSYASKVQGDVPNGPVHLGAAKTVHPAVLKVLDSAEGPIMVQIEKQKLIDRCRDLVDQANLGEQNAQAWLIRFRKAAKNPSPKNVRERLAYQICLEYSKNPRDVTKTGPDLREAEHRNGPRVSGSTSGPIGALRRAVKAAQNPSHYAATVTSHVPAAGGSIDAAQCAATALSHGPFIDRRLFNHVQSFMGSSQAKKLFAAGVKFSGNPKQVLRLAQEVASHSQDPSLMRALQTGYSMGLARRLQDVRKGGPLKNFSAAVAWELGE